MIKICIIVFVIFMAGCSGNSKETKTSAIQVDTFPIKQFLVDTSQDEGWGADMKISIHKISRTDSSTSYFLNSTSGKTNLGFQITIPTSIPDDKKATTQIMNFTSNGEISDNFITILSKLYKEKLDTASHFIKSLKTSFIDLDEFAKKEFGKASDDASETKGLKIFFESGNENDYAEIYININEKEQWVEIKEKDEGYRKQVLKALTTK